MKITIIAAGKLKQSGLAELINSYLVRFKNFKPTIHEIDDRNLSKEAINQRLFSNLKPSFIVILDETGTSLNSVELSQLIHSSKVASFNALTIIIGGSEGIERSFLAKANLVLSLSALTLPHQLVRLILVEQLYRAETIYFNHPYHRA